jgi:para-nitrobenzyl esterase
MRKTSPSLLFLEVAYFPILTIAQTSSTTVVAGKEVAFVETQSGKVKGYVHNGIYTYKGIPYAKAERFMAPSRPDP